MPPDFPLRVEEKRQSLQRFTDSDLKRASLDWGEKVRQDDFPADLVTGFSFVKEATRRVFGFSHYDVQVEAGFYLYLGWVAEMATGEGKTLMTTLPAFARSVEKRGVHIATANAYLAERDCQECRPVFEMLGVSVAYLREKIPPVEKMKIYQSDIVYGTGYEFGFDYLRDQLSLLSEGRREFGKSFVDRVKGGNDTETPTSQKELAFVIIDEIDSVLIDEGRTPLVISGSKPGESTSPGLYRVAQTLATLLEEDEHYDLDERKRSIRLTDEGRDYVYLRKPKRLVHLFKRPWHTYVESALAARYLFRCDEHYVVDSDKIMIVDEYSGRRFEDRSWRNGLHQAVETKEGVTINEESGTQASITRQRYYRMYDRLCGMTGTAKENRSELKEVYHTDVRPIPLNKVSRREVLKDRVFVDESKKRRAVVDEIKQIHEQGRPVLIGTRTIHQSESLARALDEAGLFYRLLNAKQDKEEAEIVAIAGEAGAITIATNMAGRGTDIKISSEVEATGGLHVIGYERHESRRVDRQLLGRAGRQGNRGSGRFYCSADDYIIQYYAPELAEEWERAVANDAGELDGDLARQVDVLQGKIEQIHTRQRLELLSRDKWLEDLRKKI